MVDAEAEAVAQLAHEVVEESVGHYNLHVEAQQVVNQLLDVGEMVLLMTISVDYYYHGICFVTL
jgi:hypothetical protein